MIRNMRNLKVIFLLILYVKNWPLFFANRLGWVAKNHITYYLRSGHAIAVEGGTADWWNVFYEVFVEHAYTPEGFGLSTADTVIDIGAHIGIFSLYAASKVKKVYAFEPVQANFHLLQENVKMNHCDNVVAVRAAVSDTIGTKNIFVSTSSVSHSLHIQEAGAAQELVPTISLEGILRQHNITAIDFLKMDCEGAEYDILFNCPPEILGKINRISMECHHTGEGKNAKAMESFLRQSGFQTRVQTIQNTNASYIFAQKL